jgi:hypothetical protein
VQCLLNREITTSATGVAQDRKNGMHVLGADADVLGADVFCRRMYCVADADVLAVIVGVEAVFVPHATLSLPVHMMYSDHPNPRSSGPSPRGR